MSSCSLPGTPFNLLIDSGYKLAPVFSPDGSRIAYGTIDPFDTWEVPVLGGQPRLLLKNASSLSWIDNGKHLLFSEIREGLHMILVTTNEDRGERREVYVPPGERSMVHHSYLSPDGRWVLMVEMDESGSLLPCQVVPFDGSAAMQVIGPHATCTSAAWSLDGNWVYFSANPGGRFHIWRQKFPGRASAAGDLRYHGRRGHRDESGRGIIADIRGRQRTIPSGSMTAVAITSSRRKAAPTGPPSRGTRARSITKCKAGRTRALISGFEIWPAATASV